MEGRKDKYIELDSLLYSIRLDMLREKSVTSVVDFSNLSAELISVCRKLNAEIDINERITIYSSKIYTCT